MGMRKLLDNYAQVAFHSIMSAASVAVVRGIYEDFGKGDIPSVLGALAGDVEWIEPAHPYLPHRGAHFGPDAVAANVFGMVRSTFETFAVVPESYHDAGDVVVVEGRHTGRTKDGRVIDAPACWVWTVRDGKATRNMNYADTDAWRVALGGSS
jgi:ketosteroid isomerase-like protein